jgi:hypothetical protein
MAKRREIMTRLFFLILLAAVWVAHGQTAKTPVAPTKSAPAPTPTTKGEAKETYDRIAAQIAAGDETADWTALRFAAAQADLYGKFDESEAQALMYNALGSKQYSTALFEAQQILKRNIANGNAHYVAMIVYDHLGDAAHSDAEEKIVKAISNSIFGTQTGKSAESAWVVVSVDEEYFVLRVLGLQPQKQSLITNGGRAYDEMDVFDSKNSESEFDLWFDTTFSMQQLSNALNRRHHRK